MSYKYHNGSTPEEVNSEDSDPGARSHVGVKADATKVNPSQRGENALSAAAEVVQMANPADTYDNKVKADSSAKATFTPDPKKITTGPMKGLNLK